MKNGKSQKSESNSVTLVKARFKFDNDKRGGVVKFLWSDNTDTEKKVGDFCDYLDFLKIIHESHMQKPTWL
jgi:hypothetical protein